MGMIYFDTLKFANKLEGGGFTAQQSKTFSEAFQETIVEQLVTTGHLRETENRMIVALKESEQRLATSIKENETKLTTSINAVEAKLTTSINAVETKLTTSINAVETKLTASINAVETKLTTSINAVETKLTASIKEVATSSKESELRSDTKHEATRSELYKILLAQSAFYIGALFFIFRFFK